MEEKSLSHSEIKEKLVEKALRGAGFPDREKQKACLLCKQWVAKDSGRSNKVGMGFNIDPVGLFFWLARLVSGYQRPQAFICEPCYQRRRSRDSLLSLVVLLLILGFVVQRNFHLLLTFFKF